MCVCVCVCVGGLFGCGVREGDGVLGVNNCTREIETENNRQSPPEAHLQFPV